MSKSNLLKEAIADAKAVRETAIANAKIALEEAFTPRLHSILSRKLQAEMEEEDMEDDEFELEEEYDETTPEGDGEFEGEDDDAVDLELDEEEDFDFDETETEDEVELDEEEDFDFEEESDEDELDLEAIIRELEDDDEMHSEMYDDPTGATMEEEDMEFDLEEEEMEFDLEEDEDDSIDLDEILREMGYGDDEDMSEDEDEVDPQVAGLEADLEEAYKTIKSLRGTINEVNLLNAKLLYTNKLFRSYNLTNEQKVKVVENLDRTSNVREVKLVYATLAESMKFTGTEKKAGLKTSITEGFASRKITSTAPKKEIINESADTIADRFKKLAGII